MATGFINYTKHAVAGSSRIKATTCGHIFDIRVTSNTLDNGSIITKGALEANQSASGQVYTQAAGSTTFRGKVIAVAANGNYYVEVTAVAGDLLVLQVPIIYYDYTSRMRHESNFYNEKGDVVRAYELCVNDVFELSAEGFSGSVSVGDEVKIDSSTGKLIDAA